MIVFNYLPMYGLIIAFKDYRPVSTLATAPWVGLDNFRQLVTQDDILLILRNTLGISVLGMIFSFPLSIALALLFNELQSLRFKKVVQTISYLPHFLSWAVLGGIIISFLSTTGFVNTILMSIGIINEPVIFLAEPQYFWPIAILTATWKELGWSTILFLAAIASVNPAMYESAIIDGAGRFKRMWYITLPSIKFTIAIVLIMSVSQILNSNFDQILVLSNSLNRVTSEVLDVFVYNIGIRGSRFSFATATGLLKSIVALVLLITANKVSEKLANASFF